jgi:hypothetical protein
VVKYLLDCRQQSKKEVKDMTTQEKLIKRTLEVGGLPINLVPRT